MIDFIPTIKKNIGTRYDNLFIIINKKPDVVPDFLRKSKSLTKSDWNKLSKFVDRLKSSKK